jgi:hypothetical protein
MRTGRARYRRGDRGNRGKLTAAQGWYAKYGIHLEAWDRRFIRGDTDIPAAYYERPEIDDILQFYLLAWNELVTERPVIATMASVSYGVIPRSKIKSYAEDDLGLIGEEVDLFIAIMRRVESKSRAASVPDPEMADQVAAGDAVGVKRIVSGLANKRAANQRPHPEPKKPRVRFPRHE